MEKRTRQFHVYLPDELIALIDEHAKSAGTSRSQLVMILLAHSLNVSNATLSEWAGRYGRVDRNQRSEAARKSGKLLMEQRGSEYFRELAKRNKAPRRKGPRISVLDAETQAILKALAEQIQE